MFHFFRWILKEHVKDAHFDMPWGKPEDDSNLLKGAYEH